MNFPLADFYLLRIAFLASNLTTAEDGSDIFDYLTLAVVSERTADLSGLAPEEYKKLEDFRVACLEFALIPPSSINNRIFTWEEYSTIKKADSSVAIPDSAIETKHPVDAELAHFAATLRPFFEAQLKRSFELTTRESEFL